MTRSTARLSVIIGAIGLVTLLTLGSVGFTQGHMTDARVQVRASCAPLRPVGTVVHVTLSDQGDTMMVGGTVMMVSLYATPSLVHAGEVTFVATNVGSLTHELLILPAPRNGVGSRDITSKGTIDESTSLAEASSACGAGVGAGITPGTSSWVTLRLSPGRYELLCDEPWHYANGMYQGFIVQ